MISVWTRRTANFPVSLCGMLQMFLQEVDSGAGSQTDDSVCSVKGQETPSDHSRNVFLKVLNSFPHIWDLFLPVLDNPVMEKQKAPFAPLHRHSEADVEKLSTGR
ncbi:hypothetical protein XENOCAPTIV_007334 [Xenoophorus captivus]|uniref:Uncharacterized protein n=1 Tax=Xenoophorus captivus TaxID=1517983 RepID=A0ABV0QZ01_9TELE